jgi:phosphohistidine phosphatase
MLLFILRHGQAELAAPGGKDAARPLTPQGKQAIRQVLARAATTGMKPDTTLVSPYLRARETAELAREVFGFAEPALPSNALLPDSDPESVWDEVRVHATASQLLLVGHNPLFSDLLTVLLGAGGYAIDLKTAGLACLDVGAVGAQLRGRLVWLLTPEVCR